MLKVLEITASAGYGGGPQHLFELISHLSGKVLVDVACPRQEPYWSRYEKAIKGKLVEIPERRFELRAVLKLIRHVREREIDLLHSHGKGAGVYGRVVSMLTGVPLVHTPHGIHLDHYGVVLQKIYLAYERMAQKLAAYTIFVSDSEKRRADELGLWRSVPFRIIANGVRQWPPDLVDGWRQAMRRAQNVGDDEIVVVTLSRFDYPKNMEEMARIAQKSSGLRYWFVGDGVDRIPVESICVKNGLRDVWFPGFVPDPLRYIAAADIYLSTSRWEGLPLSVLEAMALGKPVVASNVTGNQDAVRHGVTGFLYSLGNIEQASDFLHCLSRDQRLLHAMGEAGRDLQRNEFSVEIMAAQTLDVYKNVLEGSSSDF